tara:strand:- start:39550 stop:39999 length:450 start_codon:yes stop_codon:yes gene_type:complete
MKFFKKPLHFIMAFAFLATTASFAQDKVSETELTNFANAYTEIQVVNEKAQTEMVKVIENSGMEIQTFNVMYQASMNPNAPMPAEVTEADTKKYEEVVVEIEKMQPVFQKEMETAIADNNLTVDRYQQVVTMLQTDPELQQKLQSKLQQ